MTKNSSFSRFMVVFMSYCPQFWEFQGDLHGLRDPIHVCELGPKTHSFRVFMAVFMSYCPYFSGSRAICMARKTRYMFERYDQKTRRFRVLWSFLCVCFVFVFGCVVVRVVLFVWYFQ